MNALNIYFSPTGGTKKVADIFASHIADEHIDIDLCDTKHIPTTISDAHADVAIISAPVYNGRISSRILSRISAFKGDNLPCVVIAVYGNRAYEDALAELEYTATQSKFDVVGAIATVAENAVMHQYGTSRPDSKDVAILQKYADLLKYKITSGQTSTPHIPGKISDKPTKDDHLVPKATKACDSCGLCAKECPMEAIDLNNPKHVDRNKCISCMRCVKICPLQARQVNQALVAFVSNMMKSAFIAPKQNELFI